MKKLCPNLDHEDGLETVLEVPIPEEIPYSKSGTARAWQNMKSWMKPSTKSKSFSSTAAVFGSPETEIQLLLGLVGAPLIPFPISSEEQPINPRIKDQQIEASMAKYILKQYVAAVGGERALNCIESMYAMGQVRMAASEFGSGEECLNSKKKKKKKKTERAKGEMGGFVMWQKRPELWSLEMVVSGYKINAGSDGKVAWRQTPWHHSHASRGPPRPLRRFLQGLDPRSTANLFVNSTCIGEKTINKEDCFILKLEADPSALRARNSSNVEIIRHTIWGYFSQRTALLLQLEDSYLLRIKSSGNDGVFWETTMESSLQDYRTVDGGVSIAHGGETSVSLFRFGEVPQTSSKARMEEIWRIEEVDFNVKGLGLDCFMAPSDLRREEEEEKVEEECGVVSSSEKLAFDFRSASFRISSSKVAAINVDDSSASESDEDL